MCFLQEQSVRQGPTRRSHRERLWQTVVLSSCDSEVRGHPSTDVDRGLREEEAGDPLSDMPRICMPRSTLCKRWLTTSRMIRRLLQSLRAAVIPEAAPTVPVVSAVGLSFPVRPYRTLP